jgi:6-phospho-beta-glucosidase
VNGRKLVVIGGGSAYVPGFLKALLHRKDAFEGWSVVLQDIDLEHLDLIARLGARMARAAGATLEVRGEPDRPAALDGADFVLTSFRQGGFEMRHLDESIPLRHGLIGHETVGPGGLAYAMRTIPEAKAIAAEVSSLCPSAWVLNYTNPTNLVTEAVVHHTGVRILGLCDQAPGDARLFARLLGCKTPPELRSLGLNHATWGVVLRSGGEDLLPRLRSEAPALLARPDLSFEERLQVELAGRFGRMPSKYDIYYFFPERTVVHARRQPLTRARVVLAELPGIFAHLREQAAAEMPVVTRHRGGADFGDFAVDILAALSGAGDTVEPLNVRNDGWIDDLEPGLVVEVPCRIGRDRVEPMAMGRLPDPGSDFIRDLAPYQRLAAQAGWEGNGDDAVEALAHNPLVRDRDRAAAVWKDLVDGSGEWIPARLRAGG